MKWREKARQLRNEVYVLYLAFRDPRVPWYARAFIIAIIAYALSPVDLIPDFIPVLGYLDDLIIIPAGIYLALKMVPREVRDEYREKAKTVKITGGGKWIAAVVIVLIWLLVVYLITKAIWL